MTPQEQLLAALNAAAHNSAPSSADTGHAPLAPEPVCWRGLSPEDETAQLEALDHWVRWFVRRYCLDHRTVPPCWAKHGALVEELSALRTLWELCYSEDAAPADPHTFHHSLSHAIGRLQFWTQRRNCRPDDHHDDLPPDWAAA